MDIQNKMLLGACMFIVSIVSSTSYLKLTSNTRVTSNKHDLKTSIFSSSSSTLSGSKYNSILVELEYPSTFNILLKNDDILTKVIKDVTQEILVYITAPLSISSSNCYEYISVVYSKIWDEMVLKNNLGLSCYVLSNHRDGHYINLVDILKIRKFDAVYKCVDEVDSTIVERPEVSYHGAKIEELGTIRQTWNVGIRHSDIFYFDQKGERSPIFKHVAVGGTFDQLHNGHRKLLTLASGCCSKTLTIGISGDELIKNKKNAVLISSFEHRKLVVESFVRFIKPSLHLNIVMLYDIFGPTITDPSIDALAVSSETIAGALKINEIRQDSQMKPLTILVTRRCDASTLSSTFIRNQSFKY